MFDIGHPMIQRISEANFTNIVIETCPNLISLIIVDMDFRWTNFSKLSQLKQLQTLGMVYDDDDDWTDNYTSSETIIPEELYDRIKQYNAIYIYNLYGLYSS